jgi:hypothetical protein
LRYTGCHGSYYACCIDSCGKFIFPRTSLILYADPIV